MGLLCGSIKGNGIDEFLDNGFGGLALGFGVVIEDDAVAEYGPGHGLDVGDIDFGAAVEGGGLVRRR